MICIFTTFFVVFAYIMFLILYRGTINTFSNFLAKTTLLEISTPYLNTYKTFKSPVAGLLLLVTFFLFRIVWLSHIYYHILFKVPDSHLRPSAKRALLAFVFLNYYWFTKMSMIAYKKTRNLKEPKDKKRRIEKVY